MGIRGATPDGEARAKAIEELKARGWATARICRELGVTENAVKNAVAAGLVLTPADHRGGLKPLRDFTVAPRYEDIKFMEFRRRSG